MEKIYEILLIGSAAIGIYASLVLLFISKQNSLLNRLLAFFWIIISILSILNFCIIRNWTPDILILIKTFLPISYFLPAICYLYYRTYIQDDIKLKKKDLLNFIPLTLNFIYTFPLIYSIFIGEIKWKTMLESSDKQLYFYNYGPIPDRFHVFFKLAILLFYIFLIWKLHSSKNFRAFVAKNQAVYPFSIRWINVYRLTITIIGISTIFRQIGPFYFYINNNSFVDVLIPFTSLVVFDFLIVYALLNPIVLFGLPHFQSIIDSQLKLQNTTAFGLGNNSLVLPTNELISTISINEVVSKPILNTEIKSEALFEHKEASNINIEDNFVNENDKIQLLIQRINEYIENHQPYKAIDFNILMLSKALQVPQHHISYILRIVLKKSFVDFRNELRLNYVIEAVKKGKLKNLTMEAISSEAGFASRTTFYAVFKKQMGITPGQYLEELGVRNK